MSKDVKKALEHCIDNECVGCPNNEELGSGDIVCRARLLPEILEYISDLQHRLEVAEQALELACEELMSDLEFDSELDKHYNLQANIEYFKTKAREIVKSE